MAKIYTIEEEAQIAEYQAKMFSHGGKKLRALADAKSGLKRVAASREITRREDKRAAKRVLKEAIAREDARYAGVDWSWDEHDLQVIV